MIFYITSAVHNAVLTEMDLRACMELLPESTDPTLGNLFADALELAVSLEQAISKLREVVSTATGAG